MYMYINIYTYIFIFTLENICLEQAPRKLAHTQLGQRVVVLDILVNIEPVCVCVCVCEYTNIHTYINPQPSLTLIGLNPKPSALYP
jgi:hypothetical protein